MNFRIITLGCKVNQYESQVMSENMQKSGYSLASDTDTADITVINTCTVTSSGDSKNQKLVRRVRRENPHGIIVLTGCMPQAFPDDLDLFQNCDIVLGNASRAELVPAIQAFFINHQQIINISPHKDKGENFELMSATSSFEEHTRAFIKIEDGCNRFCSYCIIPYARGRVRSKDLADLHREATVLANNGYKEIVLVGINLSAFGQGTDYNLCDAVECVASIPQIERVRLGSLEPERMDNQTVMRLAKCDKLCPQFHLSLQSGCDATLKRMNRHYTCDEYVQIVERLHSAFENCAITTDIMVGFAGETPEEFQTSLQFTQKIGFAKVHTFAYSRRKGTVADKAPNQVPQNIKNQRSREMIEFTDKIRANFLQTQVGKVESVLFERRKNNSYCEGYTKNYTQVRVYNDVDLSGQIINVKITQAENDFCIGEIL